MVTTAYNFKQWFKRHYPDIMINPVYGLEAYTFDKPLSPEHMYEYNVQQLQNGHYIVFVGRTPEQVIELMRDIATNGLQYRKPQRGIPTTFSSFENWYRNKQLKPLHRTHCAKITAADALHDEAQEHVKRDWYMYEFSLDPARCDGAAELFKEPLNFAGPHVTTESGTIVLLIKSPVSAYVSKRQLFLQKFTLMQPLFEQLVTACAQGDWDKAVDLCNQYASIQFDKQVCVIEAAALKTAYEHNELSLFTRCRSNFTEEVRDGEF